MITLPNLPFNYSALEPVISTATMKVHHGKHHAKYVETVNALLGGAAADASLEAVIRDADIESTELQQNAGQAGTMPSFGTA